ncbi:MAG: peptidylprolyl isomerase [Deltaproteobacteria bacterium]|nr:peptidylprolyl isomerase [Deltaproteobacteria bacterium]
MRELHLAIALLAISAACRSGSTNGTAARVGSTLITTAQVEARAAPVLERAGREPGLGDRAVLPQDRLNIKHEALQQLIEEQLIRAQAAKLGLKADGARVAQRIKQMKANFPTEQGFLDSLKQQGRTEDTLRDAIVLNELREAVLDQLAEKPATVSQEMVDEAYERTRARYRYPARVHARVIFVRISDLQGTTDEAWALGRKKIQEAQARLKAGASFAAVARQYSDHESKFGGGDLGFIELGRWPGDIEKTAFAQAAGRVSDIVDSGDGFAIVKTEAHEPARDLPVDDVKEQIRSDLLAEARARARELVLARLRAEAPVEQIVKYSWDTTQPPANRGLPPARP